MRTKRYIDGLNNSQKIRVIINGIGFYTTVREACNLAFSSQTSAVISVLTTIGLERLSGQFYGGLSKPVTVYDEKMKSVVYDVQVDLM